MYLFICFETPHRKQETRERHIHVTIRTLCWLVYVAKADATRLEELSGGANQLLAVSRKQLITVGALAVAMATPLLLGYTVRAHLSRIDPRLVSASCIPKMSTRGTSTS